MQKEKLGITGLYIHCICSTATTTTMANHRQLVTSRSVRSQADYDLPWLLLLSP